MNQYPWPEHMDANTRRNAALIVDLIADAADRGERCPTAPYFVRRGLSSPPVSLLADIGVLRSEVYGRNYRRVFICAGPHRGKSTKAAPYFAPYKVIGPERPG
jgi:hypothetical protein